MKERSTNNHQDIDIKGLRASLTVRELTRAQGAWNTNPDGSVSKPIFANLIRLGQITFTMPLSQEGIAFKVEVRKASKSLSVGVYTGNVLDQELDKTLSGLVHAELRSLETAVTIAKAQPRGPAFEEPTFPVNR